MTLLAGPLQQFFTSHLQTQRDLSPNTIASYRDTWKLLTLFLAERHHIRPIDIDLASIDPENVTAFLDHIQNDRSVSAATRNQRLSAIRSLAEWAAPRHPEHAGALARVHAIGSKRAPKPAIAFLAPAETDALLAAPDTTTRVGPRDLAILALAVQGGLRVSELISLATGQTRLSRPRSVTVLGKGRKHRTTPLTEQTADIIRLWARQRATMPGETLFCGPKGLPLSRDAIEHRLAAHLATAAQACPSLAAKHITMHSLRHYVDGWVMWLAGVFGLVGAGRGLVPAT
jgi:site-specific recombinase XerD